MKRLLLCLCLLFYASPAWATWSAGVNTKANSSDGNPPTATLDSTGANAIVVGINGFDGCLETMSDSKNSATIWKLIGRRIVTGGPVSSIWFAGGDGLVTGTGHTFTPVVQGGCHDYANVFVQVLTNATTTALANPLDQTHSTTGTSTSIQPAAIVPTLDNEIIFAMLAAAGGTAITTISIDSGFTVVGTQNQSGTNYAGGLAYKIQTTAASTQPTFSWTNAASLGSAAVTVSLFDKLPHCSGSAPNFTAPDWDNLSTCLGIAGNVGNTITVPSGTYTATTETEVTTYVKIVPGAGGVTIIDNTCSGTCTPDDTTLISFTESSAGSIWFGGLLPGFTGFTIQRGTADHLNPGSTIGIGTNVANDGKPVIIHGNTYDTHAIAMNDTFIYIRSNRGVISQNRYIGEVHGSSCLNNSLFVQQKMNEGPSQNAWTNPPFYGMDDTTGDHNIYVEGNTLSEVPSGVDADDFGRFVFRYNTEIDSGAGAHGVDTSGNGQRYIEIYNNDFSTDPNNQPGCSPASTATIQGFIGLRGAGSVIHHNILPPITGKSSVIFQIQELKSTRGNYGCWSTLTDPGAGYPAPRQIGWGYTTGATNPGGNTTPQDIEPIYIWGNTGGGNYTISSPPSLETFDVNSPDSGCNFFHPELAPFPDAPEYIQEGRDFFTSDDQVSPTKPSYTPYTCPHPLLGFSGSCSSSAGAAAYDINDTASSTEYAFKWRNDNGSEATATAAASENANLTTTAGVTKRLRIGVDTTSSIGAQQFQLEWKKSTDSVYAALTVPQAATINYSSNSSGTTIPANVYSVLAKCWGGGGAGSTMTSGTGGGGKGGSYSTKTVSVTPGQSISVTIGAAGTSGASPTNGGQSNVTINGTTVCQAAGGNSATYNSTTGATGINGSNVGDSSTNGSSGTDGNGTTSGAGGINGEGTGTGGVGVATDSNGNVGTGVGAAGSGAKAVASAATDTFTTGTAATWTAPANLSGGVVTLEAWGGGGAGSTRTTSGTGGGGRGGDYSKCNNLPVTASMGYSYTVGAGGTTNTTTQSVANGKATTFASNSGTCLAAGGAGVINNTTTAGTTTNGTSNGDTIRTGGNGANGATNGGGGGGSPGDSGNGGNATNETGGSAGSGTLQAGQPGGGGGASANANGTGGTQPGSGGGGARRQNGTRTGGPGGAGLLKVEYNTSTTRQGGAGQAGFASLTYTPAPQITLAASSNIAASAATVTTAQLTPPSGKTTASFSAGRISDDTNPMPSSTPGADQYTENEWSLVADAAHVSDGDSFNFRVTKAGTALDTYPFTPTLTIGNGHTISIETAANGSGSAVASQSVEGGASGTVTAYCIERDDMAAFVANDACTWSLANLTVGVVSGDLVPAMDNKSAVFTGHALGTGRLHTVFGGLTADSGTLTVVDTTAPTPGNSGTITVSSVSQTHIDLAWTAATDTVWAQNTLQYQVYRSGSNNINTLNNAKNNGVIQHAYSANTLSFDVTGPQITCGTTFYFAVLVKDGSNNEAYYPSISQATDACGAAQVTGAASSRMKVKQ